MLKLYEKSNHLILAIEQTPENKELAIQIAYLMRSYGPWVMYAWKVEEALRRWPK